jgi:hypothetical protein
VLTVSTVSGQGLRDKARQQGGTASTAISVNSPITDPAKAMSLSDLVIHGRVIELKTRLTEDESDVVTEYTITPIQAFKDRRATTVATPGGIPKIVVRRSGGRLVTEDGLRLSTSVNVFPEGECFVVGDEVVVFLIYHNDTGVYTFSAGEFSAFRVRDGKVSPMTKRVAERRHVSPIDAGVFFTDIQRMR